MKKTELYIEKFRLDLFPDESFLLNYDLTDISEIGSKTGGYSKELNLPATDNNNNIFSHLYEVNVESNFNPIIRKSATLYIDSLPIMTGYFKLTKITTVDNKYHTYVGLLFEDTSNFISALSDSMLSDLNFPITGTTRDLTTYDGIIDIGEFSTVVYEDEAGDDKAWALNYHAIITGDTYCSLVDVTRTKQPQTLTGNWVDDQVTAIRADVAGTYKWDFRFQFESTTLNYPSFEYYIIHNKNGQDIDVAYGNFPNSGGLPQVFWILNLQNIIVEMSVGDTLRLELWSEITNYTVNVTPPSYATFRAYAYTGSTTNVGYQKIDINYITDNIYNVTDSDDGNIVFPLVDYSKNYSMQVSTSNIQTTNSLHVDQEDLRPAIFVKPIWDKIFDSIGFRYNSDFINSDLFKKIILLGGVKEDDLYNIKFKKILDNNYNLIEPRQDRETYNNLAVVNGYEYRAYMLGGELGDWDNTFTYNAYQELVKTGFSYDGKNTIYKPSYGYYGGEYGYIFFARTKGKYAYNVNMSALSKPVTLADNTTVTDYALCYRLRVMRLVNGAYSTDPVYNPSSTQVNGTYSFTSPYLDQWEVVEEATWTRMNNGTNQTFELKLQGDVELEKGDMLRAILLCSASDQVLGITFPTTILHSQTTLYADDTYVEFAKLGDYVNFDLSNLSQLLPRSLKQADFITNIGKMFNLYFETDKVDPKLINIEPRDDYYDKGHILDYSDKLDISKPIEQTIISHNQPKYVNFNFKNVTNDYWCAKYSEFVGTNMKFGGYRFTSPNEYVTNESKNDLIFAATYMQEINDSNIIIPRIIDSKIMENDNVTTDAFFYVEPRLLIYGGIQTIPYTANNNYNIILNYYSVAGQNIQKTFFDYPYAGHLDDPRTPVIDINWFTDTNYLPNLFENKLSTTSTSINVDNLNVGDELSITIATGRTEFTYNDDLIKYVKLYIRPATTYIIGKLIDYNTATGVLKLEIIDYNGTGTPIVSWNVMLINVKIKHDLYSYYAQEMLELTDTRARLIKCNLYLTPLDINQLRFNNILFLNNEYWRLLSVKDYDTSVDVNETTEVELLRILGNEVIDFHTLKGGFSDQSAGVITERVLNPNIGEVSYVRDATQKRYVSDSRNYILLNSNNELPYQFKTNIKPRIKSDYRAEMDVNNSVTYGNSELIVDLYPLSVGELYEIDCSTGTYDWTLDYNDKRVIIIASPEDNMQSINITLPTLSESYDDGYKITMTANTINIVANIGITNDNVNLKDFRYEAGTECVIQWFHGNGTWYINFK